MSEQSRPDIAEQLLGRNQVSSWCADHDPTGRYVCARIRDHALDWHAGRNDAGGIHQWPATTGTSPERCFADCPAGGRHGSGNTEDCTCPGYAPASAEGLRTRVVDVVLDVVADGEIATQQEASESIADVVLAAVQPELTRHAAEITRLRATNESLLAMLERMETLHVTWLGPDGEEYHPDWCRECRVDKVRAELADMRASREAWAMEATSQDGLADRFLVWYSRVHDAVSQAAKLPPSQTVDDVVEAVGRLGRERDTAVVALASDRIVYCDKPEDRLWHAADRTWWRRDEDGRLVRADAPPWFAAGPADLRLAMIRAIADHLARIAASEDMPHRQEIQDAADALAGRLGAPGSPWDQWLAPMRPVEPSAEEVSGA